MSVKEVHTRVDHEQGIKPGVGMEDIGEDLRWVPCLECGKQWLLSAYQLQRTCSGDR
jgi:hypothetical protein